VSWFDDAMDIYGDELEGAIISETKKWREMTLDEAMKVGLTSWDKQVPEELANIDMRINVRVDDMIVSCLRSVARSYGSISRGNIYKVITKHGMAIVGHELSKVSNFIRLCETIRDTVDKYDSEMAKEFTEGFSVIKFDAREEYRYTETIAIRPVWWVYCGTDKISQFSSISKSDLVRFYLLSSLATRFNMVKGRKAYYINCVNRQIYNITNVMVTMCRRVGMCPKLDMKNEILGILDKLNKYDSNLCKELKSILQK